MKIQKKIRGGGGRVGGGGGSGRWEGVGGGQDGCERMLGVGVMWVMGDVNQE